MIEASVADLPGGVDGSKGYEIYILMEWCAGAFRLLAALTLNVKLNISYCHRRRYYRHDEHSPAKPNDGKRDSQNLCRYRRSEFTYSFDIPSPHQLTFAF